MRPDRTFLLSTDPNSLTAICTRFGTARVSEKEALGDVIIEVGTRGFSSKVASRYVKLTCIVIRTISMGMVYDKYC